MLSPHLMTEVRRLLAQGNLSQRQIARAVGVNRKTVADVAAWKRPQYAARAEPEDAPEPAGPPVRCPGCGGKVYLPCQLCRARQAAARGRLLPPRPPENVTGWEPLSLELKEAHRCRYEQVRARREAAALAEDPSSFPSLQETQL